MKVRKDYSNPTEESSSKRSNSINSGVNHELFDKLRSLRSNIAFSQRVPAYIVFTDATLRDMCLKTPITNAEFLKVLGIGQAKLEKYGQLFIKQIILLCPIRSRIVNREQ
jgi:superfamily II DNA helicase RecQ